MVHEGKIDEALEAAPENGGAGRAVMTSSHIATELGQPAHRVTQTGGLVGGRRRRMDGAIERLPFGGLQQDGAGEVGHSTGQ